MIIDLIIYSKNKTSINIIINYSLTQNNRDHIYEIKNALAHMILTGSSE